MIEMNVNLDVVLRDGEFFRNIDPFIGNLIPNSTRITTLPCSDTINTNQYHLIKTLFLIVMILLKILN